MSVIAPQSAGETKRMQDTNDLYAELQVHPSAAPKAIEAAYLRLSCVCRPALNKSAEASDRMKCINYAYEVLGDPDKRAQYDRRRGYRVAPKFPNPESALYETLDVHVKYQDGATQLHMAAKAGKVEMVRALIAAGADVNAGNDHNETPLHQAAMRGCVDAGQALISAGADVNAKDNDGDAPIHIAVDYEHIEMVRDLISAGADVNAKGFLEETPLQVATRKGRFAIAQVLASAVANSVRADL